MSIWYDADENIAAGSRPAGARTHVVAIGASAYKGLPLPGPLPPQVTEQNPFALTQVDSPATSAFSVASWFRYKLNNPRAPIGKIWLLLSPSPHESSVNPGLQAAATSERRAITANAAADLKAWRAACSTSPGNIAILYAAGHGIARSQDDSLVLLEDFGEQIQPIAGSLDMGGLKRGMFGSGRAQTQLFFADACRISPENAGKLQGLGGLSFREDGTGSDHRSVAMYFSATPYESALALRGRPTLFGQALIDCLDSLAVVGPDETDPNWHVTTDSLTAKLKRRVSDLAKAQNRVQDTAHNEQGGAVTLHVCKTPPQVNLTIQVNPAPDVSKTWIRLWTGNRRTKVKDRETFASHPFQVDGLDPGLYSLDVGFTPPPDKPFEDLVGIAVDAQRPPVPPCLVDFL
jgi:hypothetical protein